MSTVKISKAKESWLQSLKIYLDRRVIAILFLGFSSGLPILLVLTTLSTWLREEGVSRSTIGLFGFVMAPYALKFIWAPLVDRMPIPGLTAMMGRRRSWMLIAQIALVIVIYLFGRTDPGNDLYWTAFFAVLITFFSATQDIAVDAYRIDSLPEEQLGAGASVVVLGYRIGMWLSTAGALFIAAYYDWATAFATMAAFMGIGIATTLLVSEPKGSSAALVDDEAKEQESKIRTLDAEELRPWQGIGGLLLITALVLLALQPLSYLFAFVSGHHGVLGSSGAIVAGVRLALTFWGMWVGYLMFMGKPSAPGEAKDYSMVALLWILAEVAGYGIPESSVWFAEIYAWTALYAIWWISDAVTMMVAGHGIAQESVIAPVWLFTMGIWLRFFFFVYLYGFFYFSKRAVANFGLVDIEHENRVHLWTRRAIVEPYYDFFRRYGVGVAIGILLLISVFKAPDAVLTSMANPFYIDVGFTKEQIAWVSKTFGLWMTLLGGVVGGVVVHRIGLMKSMALAVVVMAFSNLMFALLAHFGADALAITETAFQASRDLTEQEIAIRSLAGSENIYWFYALIIIENISGGLGTAVFVAYLSALCNRSYSAVQYAMLTSFMQMFAKFIVVPSSGFYADGFGWFWFFVTSTMFAIPALILLAILSFSIKRSELKNNRQATETNAYAGD